MTTQNNTYTLQDAAKMLGIGPNTLFAMLRERQVLNHDNIPYQRYIDRGLLTVHRGHWHHPDIGMKYYARTMVTNRGMNWLARLIDIAHQVQAAPITQDRPCTST